ncbi:quinone oxidoreductase family protein [Runella slithyformis]|uniref:NADPH:quinone reductase n=1 Tax=Runella slithyformis (strain ATCC 29530 / DSM 19594 / LMG 11500 / NCIMB 11436 / LSU 4) TaxID=761193 RepID=A0A7U3ZL04_RUNSL|nr:quinone oxidoreductase [Runella slithyformis]AEI49159.1 NADPH:quinone reductase [Runella slithyformis DSM 19594]
MNRIIVNEFGGPEKLTLHEVAVPTAGDGQIVIKVEAAGVNFSDGMQRRNQYVFPVSLPYLPGFEVAGIVTEAGKGVENIAVGDRVVAMLPGGGGYAEYAVTAAYLAAVIPPAISARESLGLQVQGLTAYLLLKDGAKLQAGQTVLIHAAAGGVGTLQLQIAKQMGAAKIIATASNAEKLAIAKSLGADELINYTESDWVQQVNEATGGKGVDLIVDSVGGETLRNSLNCLAPFGKLISFGNPTGGSTSIEAFTLVNNNQSLLGFGLASYFQKPDLMQEAYQYLFSQTASGKLKVHIGQTFALKDAAKAHRQMENRQTTGKTVLIP